MGLVMDALLKDLLLVVMGIGIACMVHVAMEAWSRRARRFHLGRDYFRPCTNCRMREQSRVGEAPERSETLIARQARRLTRLAGSSRV